MKLEKVTKTRWYDDACGAALAMELVGERWAIFVVRELMFGPLRFGELRAGLPGISANVLKQRLEGLEESGIVRRRTLPQLGSGPGSVQVYELTEWGYESEGVLLGMCRWAMRSPAHDPMLPLSPAAMMLSLKAMCAAGRGEAMTAGFRFAADAFVGTLTDGAFQARRGDGEADFTLVSDTRTLMFTIYGRQPIAIAESAGTLVIEGNRALAERFVTLFPLPEKVSS